MNVAYKCKFCGREGIAVADDEGASMFVLEKWTPALCCDRCADFMVTKRNQQAKIERACVFLGQSRQTLDGSKLREIEAAVREKLVEMTKRFSAIVCDHYRKTNVWENDFVEMLMDHPDKLYQICAQYVRGIRTIHDRQPTTELQHV